MTRDGIATALIFQECLRRGISDFIHQSVRELEELGAIMLPKNRTTRKTVIARVRAKAPLLYLKNLTPMIL